MNSHEPPTVSVIPLITAQYAEQAAFLWSQRDGAVAAPDPTLADLGALDERLEAHLDGLRIAGPDGWPYCLEALGEGLGGEVFTAALLALEADDAAAIAAVESAVVQSPALAREFIAALGWLAHAHFHARIRGFMDRRNPLWRHIGIAAHAIRRDDCGADLTQALADPDPRLGARAARAAGESARLDLRPALAARLDAVDPATRFWAAWSLALLGERERSIAALATVIRTPGQARTHAMQVLARVLGPDGIRHWWGLLAEDDVATRLRILGLGACGDPAAIPWLIERMADRPLARGAGAAVRLITGLDLAAAGLDRPPPAGFVAGPGDDPADDDVALAPDAELPWPDAERVGAWWRDHGPGFLPGARHLSGHPVTPAHCWALLHSARQPERMAAALELALMDPTQPLFETRAPAWRQAAWLAALGAETLTDGDQQAILDLARQALAGFQPKLGPTAADG